MFFIPYGTREAVRRIRFPYVTLLLVLVNVIVFIFEVVLLVNFGEAGLNSFLDHFAAIPSDLTDGTPLEVGLLTSMFLHGGLLHIIGNMMYLLPFGDNVEDRLGHLRYVLFYILCGVAAAFAYTLFDPHSNTPLIGASGAIAGVLGGYLRLHPKGQVKGFLFIIILLIPITLPAVLFIGYWFIMQIFGSVASLGSNAVSTGTTVAFMAHVGGFIAGYLLAPLMALRERRVSGPPEAEIVS